MVCNTSTHRFKSGLRLWKALDESGAFLLQKIREYKEAGNDEIHVICYFLLFVFTGVIEQEAAQSLSFAGIFRTLRTMAMTIRREVRSSATGKASQTPVIPKRAARITAQRLIATKPRSTEVRKAQAALSVALKDRKSVV